MWKFLVPGVQVGEKPLVERAFHGHHDIRCLDVFLDADTAPIATGHEEAVGRIVDATLRNVLDYTAGRRSENVLVPAG